MGGANVVFWAMTRRNAASPPNDKIGSTQPDRHNLRLDNSGAPNCRSTFKPGEARKILGQVTGLLQARG